MSKPSGPNYWRVTCGDLKDFRVRAVDPHEAFLLAVIFGRPRRLGAVAEIRLDGTDDDDHKYYTSTHVLLKDYQDGKDWPWDQNGAQA